MSSRGELGRDFRVETVQSRALQGAVFYFMWTTPDATCRRGGRWSGRNCGWLPALTVFGILAVVVQYERVLPTRGCAVNLVQASSPASFQFNYTKQNLSFTEPRTSSTAEVEISQSAKWLPCKFASLDRIIWLSWLDMSQTNHGRLPLAFCMWGIILTLVIASLYAQ